MLGCLAFAMETDGRMLKMLKRRDSAGFIWLVCILFPLSILQSSLCLGQAEPGLSRLKDLFAHPPGDSRIMMRWWWFGPAVAEQEIERNSNR